jgi:hypothetical protein
VNRLCRGLSFRAMGHGHECERSNDDRQNCVNQDWAATPSRQHDPSMPVSNPGLSGWKKNRIAVIALVLYSYRG